MIGLALVVVSIAATVLGTPLSTSPVAHRQQPTLTLAPVIQVPPALAHTAINNSYIVVLKPDLGVSAFTHLNLLRATSGSALFDDFSSGLRHVFDSHIKGYTGIFSEDTIERIRAQPEVDYIEQDQEVRALGVETQRGAPWVSRVISLRFAA
jgi:cerevisin